MSRMENLQPALDATTKAQINAEGGMTEDDLYMRGGQLAAMFCIGFAFVAPCILLWQAVY